MKYLLMAAILIAPTSVADAADSKPIVNVKQALALPLSFSVEDESLRTAVDKLQKQVNAAMPKNSPLRFEIRIMGADLQVEGFTQNQRIAKIKLVDRPVHESLTMLVQKTQGNHDVKDTADSRQSIVWVEAADPKDASKRLVLITTRQMAKKRTYRLPKAFRPKKPKEPKPKNSKEPKL